MESFSSTTPYIRDKLYNDKEATQIAYYARKNQTKYAEIKNPSTLSQSNFHIMQFRPCENLNNFINKKKLILKDGKNTLILYF